MKSAVFFLVTFTALLLSESSLAQNPHITGTIKVSTVSGTLRGDVIISNLPHIEDYTILLNKGLNIEYLRNETGAVNYYYNTAYDEKVSEEAFQYYIPNNDNTGKFLPRELRIKYTGAFPVINSYSEAYEWGDWKGNIAFQKNTFRASEQSVWYPILYDVKNDVLHNKYTYALEIVTEEGNSIYINGSAPSSNNTNLFTSEIPVSLLLFAGKFTFSEINGIYIVNGKLNSAKENTLSNWTNEIITYYERKLNIPYGQTVTFLGAHPTSIKNGWMFVTYPTIAVVGNDRWSLSGFFNDETGNLIDNSSIGFIAHELGHYYFGTHFVPNDKLNWIFLEGMTEYISLQVVKEILGEEEYHKKLQNYIKNSKELDVISLNKITQNSQINGTYRYNYFPLLITALEKEIGLENIWKWYQLILNSKDVRSDYNFFKSTLLQSGMSEERFERFEENFITSTNAKEHVIEATKSFD